jgi:hypothetical protein
MLWLAISIGMYPAPGSRLCANVGSVFVQFTPQFQRYVASLGSLDTAIRALRGIERDNTPWMSKLGERYQAELDVLCTPVRSRWRGAVYSSEGLQLSDLIASPRLHLLSRWLPLLRELQRR